MRQIFSFGVVLETIFPDGVVSKLFPTWGSYLREKHVMQDPNRQNQWRVWCPWANRQRQWRYAHAEAKSPVQMATCLALWESPIKQASSMVWSCRSTSQALFQCKLGFRYFFRERGVATAIGELPASCNSHWRFRAEKIAIWIGDFVLIYTKTSFSCVLTITSSVFSCVLEITSSFETKNSFSCVCSQSMALSFLNAQVALSFLSV